MTGNVRFDDNGDRHPNYWLWGLGPHSEKFEFIADIRVNELPEQVGIGYHGTKCVCSRHPPISMFQFPSELDSRNQYLVLSIHFFIGFPRLLFPAIVIITP